MERKTSAFRDVQRTNPEPASNNFAQATELRSRARCNILFGAGLLLRSNRALEAVALLQTRPIGCDIWPKVLGEPDIAGEAERVTNDNVSGGEATGAQGFGIRGRCFNGAQPA
jgi:hypothetical protein